MYVNRLKELKQQGYKPVSYTHLLYTGFKDLHILLAIDVHGHSGISSLGMCHHTEASAVGRGDTLDRTDVYKRQQ